MNPSTAIKITNVSKQYRLGLVGTGTLSHDLKRWWTMNVLGKEDPNLRVGEANVRDIKGESDYVWALQDINLEIEQGDVVGIIGKNGAGKSTLLKILSRVTKPTTGNITYRGRMGSLLEVGTGFHAEMTGRENIYMNGSIMGMTRYEITRKIDEIIAFAGVERYIDTPVKRYSSGMTVRLGFAVAAHLEPDILVVDEVLAVGDAEFQKKAIGKMQDISKGQGRTVLFVSHNMAAIENLCTSGILIDAGTVSYEGTAVGAVQKYYENTLFAPNEARIKSRKVFIKLDFENPEKIWRIGSSLNLSIEFDELYKNHYIDIAFYDNSGQKVFSIEGAKDYSGKQLKLGSFKTIELINTGIVNSMLTIDLGIKEHILSGYIYLESSSYYIRTQEQSTIHPINGKYLPKLEIHV